jgi:hypothetical protein
VIRLAVYDVRGQHVATLARGAESAGSHVIEWNTRDSQARRVAGGVYFVQLTAGGAERTLKVLVAR